MKKYLLFAFCAVLLFVASGCGTKKVTCTATKTEGETTMKLEAVAELDKEDKVTAVEVTYDISDKETAEFICTMLKASADASKGEEVNCNGTKITIKGSQEVGEENIVGKTKTEFVDMLKEEGFTCK